MAWIILIAYITIFILQIVLFVLSIRRKTKKLWVSLFLSELIPIPVTIALTVYYNTLSGPGFMYFFEALISLLATLIDGLNFFISVLVAGILYRNKIIEKFSM